MTHASQERRAEADRNFSGMRPCSDRGGREGEVLDWREEGQPLTGQEARGVQEVVERALRQSSDTYGKWHKSLRTVARWQGWASNPLLGERGCVDAQEM